MKFHMGVVSKAKRLFVPYSPAANTKKNTDGGFSAANKQVGSGISFIGSPDFGCKEEAFFDSKGWFDSDCDDDFFSVNGDFTPSRGSTPNYQITSRTTPLNKSIFGGSVHSESELSTNYGKKKLAELLQESLQVELDDRVQKATNSTEETNGRADDFKPIFEPTTLKSSLATPHCQANSSSSVLTPNSEIKYRKQQARRSSHCCLPSFTHNLSFNERKKPTTPQRYSN